MNNQKPSPDNVQYHPTFLHSRREALIIFCIWVACLLWAVPYCYLTGYGHPIDPDNLSTVLGIPSWVFWGIFAPWLVADAFTIWFCFFYMQDDELGVADEGGDGARSADHGEQVEEGGS